MKNENEYLLCIGNLFIHEKIEKSLALIKIMNFIFSLAFIFIGKKIIKKFLRK